MDMRRNWDREETMLAFELYCTIPSGQDTANNPLIKSLATAIDRTPNSVKLKLQNFKSYDPSYISDGRVGLSHGSKLDKEICEEFFDNWDDLVVKTYKIKERLGLKTDLTVDSDDAEYTFVARDVLAMSRQRIGQSFFRRTLLASYSNMCCITGINHPLLLRASHIKPWAMSNDINEKANPQNGILLNSLHDVAFDKGLITITPSYKIIVSSQLPFEESWNADFFAKYNGVEIRKPNRFLPAKEFVEYHNDVIFKG